MFLDSLPSGKETGIEKDSRAHTGGKWRGWDLNPESVAWVFALSTTTLFNLWMET